MSDSGISNMTAVKLDEKDTGNKEVKLDGLCGGPVTANTPEDSIVIGYTPSSKPIVDRYDPEWLKGFFAAANISAMANNDGKTSTTPCDRPNSKGTVNISTKIVGAGQNILEVSWSGDRPIAKFRVSVDGKVLKETTYEDAARNGTDRISTTSLSASNAIVVDLIDAYGYRYSYSTNGSGEGTSEITPTLPSINEDNTNIEPSISITNPSRGSISIYAGDMFNLRFGINVGTTKRTINVTLDGKNIQSATSGDTFVIPMLTADLTPGNHQVNVTVTDGNEKTASKSITLTILAR